MFMYIKCRVKNISNAQFSGWRQQKLQKKNIYTKGPQRNSSIMSVILTSASSQAFFNLLFWHHTSTWLFFSRPAPPTCSVSLHGVPDVAVEVVVTSQQQTAGARESHGGDATDDVVMAVEAELLVCTQVKQPAGGIIGACGEGAAVGKELRRSTGGWVKKKTLIRGGKWIQV